MPDQQAIYRYGIEDEPWFAAVRAALRTRGFTIRLQPKSLIVEHEGRSPRVFGCARDMLEFAGRQDLAINPQVYAAADLYGDGDPKTLEGRRSKSPFETPAAAAPAPGPVSATGWARSPAGPASAYGLHQALEAEILRLRAQASEAEQQRDLWRMTATAAQERLAALEADGLSGLGPGASPSDRRIDRIKRMLARELHPDLASGPDERRMREDLFKRIWAKFEQIF